LRSPLVHSTRERHRKLRSVRHSIGLNYWSPDTARPDTLVADTAELEPLVDRVLASNPGQVAAYKGGKEGLLGFFVGQVMKETQGKADPKIVNELLREKLK